jgi:hypothetical protein
MNDLRKIQKALDIFDLNTRAVPDVLPHESERFIKAVRRILKWDEFTDKIDEDIVKPSASEVQQMIDDLRDEMNAEISRVRSAATLHLQNWHK